MDEIYLSTSLMKMNYHDLLFSPLNYRQKAPVAFLLIVKLIVSTFGYRELTLRLVPFIFGVLATLLFVKVSNFYLSKWASILAIGIFCLSPALIYHSVEIKQYSTELFCTVISFYLMIKFADQNKLLKLLAWGGYGCIILWFSYSSVFILAGIGIGIAIKNIAEKKWKIFFSNMIPFSMWLSSFIINYIFFTHKHNESEWIVYWFRYYQNFMPLPPRTFLDVKWYVINIYRIIDYPLGLLWNFTDLKAGPNLNIALKMPFLPIGLILLGLYRFIKSKPIQFLVLFFPIILTLLASGLELYPLTERFWVFISPILIIILAKGYEKISEKIKSNKITAIIFVLIIIAPMIQSLLFTFDTNKFYIHKKSYQREALIFIDKQYKMEDAVYIYWNDLPGYKLYKDLYKFRFKGIEGMDVRKESKNFPDYFTNLKPDFDKLTNNKRIFLIFNTEFLTDIGDKVDDPKWYYKQKEKPTDILVQQFKINYRQMMKFRSKDVTVYLFERKIK